MRPTIIIKIIIQSVLIALAGVAVIHADEPIPAKASLVFPGVAPTPAAPVLPDAVSTLSADQLFVVTSDEPFALIGSPARLVKITPEKGPLRIRAAFADGTGKIETRNYAAKFIAIVETAGEGRVELIGIPNGFTDEGDFTRRLVDCGKGPIPPPDVEPEPVDQITSRIHAAMAGQPADAKNFAVACDELRRALESGTVKRLSEIEPAMKAGLEAVGWPKGKYSDMTKLAGELFFVPAGPDGPIDAATKATFVANLKAVAKACEGVK